MGHRYIGATLLNTVGPVGCLSTSWDCCTHRGITYAKISVWKEMGMQVETLTCFDLEVVLIIRHTFDSIQDGFGIRIRMDWCLTRWPVGKLWHVDCGQGVLLGSWSGKLLGDMDAQVCRRVHLFGHWSRMSRNGGLVSSSWVDEAFWDSDDMNWPNWVSERFRTWGTCYTMLPLTTLTQRPRCNVPWQSFMTRPLYIGGVRGLDHSSVLNWFRVQVQRCLWRKWHLNGSQIYIVAAFTCYGCHWYSRTLRTVWCDWICLTVFLNSTVFLKYTVTIGWTQSQWLHSGSRVGFEFERSGQHKRTLHGPFVPWMGYRVQGPKATQKSRIIWCYRKVSWDAWRHRDHEGWFSNQVGPKSFFQSGMAVRQEKHCLHG